MNEVERTERMLEIAARDPKKQQVIADARMFDEIRKHPGWQRLFEKVQSKKGRWMEDVARRFMGPKKNWPEPEEIAYYQGFYQGAIFVLAQPEHAEASLERIAKIAWTMALEEIDSEEG